MSNDARKLKQRSPSYPALDLETAIERTRQLWHHAQRHPVPVSDALELWGYSTKSSGGLVTVAALKKYGLVEDEGARGMRIVKVSDEGRAIVLDEQDSRQRREKIRQAALAPQIHQELWEKYEGSIPPDGTLRFHLVHERAFSERGARDFIEEFRKTLEFSGLSDESSNLSRHDDDKDQTRHSQTVPIGQAVEVDQARPIQPVKSMTPAYTTPAAGSGAPPAIQFPVASGGTVVVQASQHLSEDDWQQMMTILNTLKSSLLRREPPQEAQPDSDTS